MPEATYLPPILPAETPFEPTGFGGGAEDALDHADSSTNLDGMFRNEYGFEDLDTSGAKRSADHSDDEADEDFEDDDFRGFDDEDYRDDF